ncbi:hypothetical protein GQ600_7212 [Phytophthora cactorum]|nr:hypothetical protein GQ600_7212 [Phytophthora cactorum]
MEYRVRKRDVNGACRLPRSLEEALPDAVVRRFLLRAGFRSSSDRAAARCGAITTTPQLPPRRRQACVRALRYPHVRLRRHVPAGGRACVRARAFHVTELVECNSLFSRPLDASDEPDTEPGARYKKTDFVANYTAWREEMGEMEDQVSEPSEWSYSDSDTETEDQDMDTDASQPWQPDEEKFMASLENAQELVDEKLLQEPEDEGENQPGQGYYSDYDDSYEPEYLERQRAHEEDEDAQWNKVGQLHVLQHDEDSDPGELQDFGGSLNLYVVSRQEFLRVFRTLLNLTLNMGELQISSLEMELQMQREKVNELCETIAANKATFKAKELAMQQQIEQLKKQLLGQQDVQMETSPILKKKKSSGKRKATSKKTHTVRKGLSKSSNGSTSVVGALRSRGQNHAGTKKVKASLV